MSPATLEPLQHALDKIRLAVREEILGANDFNKALLNARFLGSLNSHNNDGVLGDDELEQGLFDKFVRPKLGQVDSMQSDRPSWVHVISQTYDWGGHTLLLKNLVKELNVRGYDQSILVTRSSTPGFIAEMSAFAPVVSISGQNPVERFADLLRGPQTRQILCLMLTPMTFRPRLPFASYARRVES